MLAHKFLLRGKDNFEKVKNEGRLYQKPFFGISVYKRKDKDVSKFGFVISSKVSKLAVQRNRIKRAIDTAVRYEMTQIKNGYDVVFLVKSLTAKKTTDEIMKAVKVAIKDAGLSK